MGLCILIFSFLSNEHYSAPIAESSTWFAQVGQLIAFLRTCRGLPNLFWLSSRVTKSRKNYRELNLL
uniref:AC4 protein n=1 Tax=Tomato leaf curl New Delhi virus TaxID=223347 RepID=A7U6C9_9GEMI|nr:AC4 protein [Tomato leaf curl New Delhi virus]